MDSFADSEQRHQYHLLGDHDARQEDQHGSVAEFLRQALDVKSVHCTKDNDEPGCRKRS